MAHKIAAFIFLLLTFSISTYSQATKIEGVVEDPAGRPVAGATVILKDKATQAERTVVTNGEGRFSFDATIQASFELTVTAVGFEKIIRDASTPGTSETIVLQPQAIKEQVTVTA